MPKYILKIFFIAIMVVGKYAYSQNGFDSYLSKDSVYRFNSSLKVLDSLLSVHTINSVKDTSFYNSYAKAGIFSLNQLLFAAVNNNPELTSMQTRIEAEKYLAEQRTYLPDPMFEFELDDIMSDFKKVGMINFYVSQMFPFPGKLELERKSVLNTRDMLISERLERAVDILNMIKINYYDLPIAKEISKAVQEKYTVLEFKSITGKGAQGMVNGEMVKIVSPGYLRENNIAYENQNVNTFFEQGKTVVFVLVNDTLKGAIALSDLIRPESKQAIQELKDMGIKCIMITGDNSKVAESVSKEIGLDEYIAEVLPQDKAKKVKEIQQRGLTVAMTGDGVNDAPALAQADIGIAIGAGTDVAIETADVILIKSNPLDVVNVVKLSRVTYNKMVQNLIWATGYNVFAIPLAAGVLFSFGILLSPALGAVLMSLSTVIVAINARFLKIA